MTLWLWMSGKRNVSVCRGHELANALYRHRNKISCCCHILISPRSPSYHLESLTQSFRFYVEKFNSMSRLSCPFIPLPPWQQEPVSSPTARWQNPNINVRLQAIHNGQRPPRTPSVRDSSHLSDCGTATTEAVWKCLSGPQPLHNSEQESSLGGWEGAGGMPYFYATPSCHAVTRIKSINSYYQNKVRWMCRSQPLKYSLRRVVLHRARTGTQIPIKLWFQLWSHCLYRLLYWTVYKRNAFVRVAVSVTNLY